MHNLLIHVISYMACRCSHTIPTGAIRVIYISYVKPEKRGHRHEPN